MGFSFRRKQDNEDFKYSVDDENYKSRVYDEKLNEKYNRNSSEYEIEEDDTEISEDEEIEYEFEYVECTEEEYLEYQKACGVGLEEYFERNAEEEKTTKSKKKERSRNDDTSISTLEKSIRMLNNITAIYIGSSIILSFLDLYFREYIAKGGLILMTIAIIVNVIAGAVKFSLRNADEDPKVSHVVGLVLVTLIGTGMFMGYSRSVLRSEIVEADGIINIIKFDGSNAEVIRYNKINKIIMKRFDEDSFKFEYR